jgi:hypothetical protein
MEQKPNNLKTPAGSLTPADSAPPTSPPTPIPSLSSTSTQAADSSLLDTTTNTNTDTNTNENTNKALRGPGPGGAGAIEGRARREHGWVNWRWVVAVAVLALLGRLSTLAVARP